MDVRGFVTGYPCDVIVLTQSLFSKVFTLDINAKTTSKHVCLIRCLQASPRTSITLL